MNDEPNTAPDSPSRLAAALDRHTAAEYLGVSVSWLVAAPVPRVDLRLPGATRPVWRWRCSDLDAYLASRVVPPGHPSPFDI